MHGGCAGGCAVFAGTRIRAPIGVIGTRPTHTPGLTSPPEVPSWPPEVPSWPLEVPSWPPEVPSWPPEVPSWPPAAAEPEGAAFSKRRGGTVLGCRGVAAISKRRGGTVLGCSGTSPHGTSSSLGAWAFENLPGITFGAMQHAAMPTSGEGSSSYGAARRAEWELWPSQNGYGIIAAAC